MASIASVGRSYATQDKDTVWRNAFLVFLLLTILASIAINFLFPDFALMATALPLIGIVGLVMVVRPEYALLLSIAYVPFESNAFNPIHLPGGLSISKIVGALVIAVFAFDVLFRGRKFRVLDDSQDFLIVLLAAAMLFSGISSEFPAKSFSATSRMLRIFAFYLAAKNLLQRENTFMTAMWAILLTGTYASMWGINEYFQSSRIHDIRIGGIYMDPNDYAALTIVVVVMGIHLTEIIRHYGLKIVAIISTLICLYGILLSGSRGGFLALGIVIGLYIWRHPRRKLLIMATLATLIITLPVWPESVTQRIFGADDALSDNVYTQTAEHSVERRTSYLDFGAQLLSESPALGAGYGTFSSQFEKSDFIFYDNPLTANQRFRVAHNAFLEVGVGMGVVGLFIYVLLLLTTWVKLRNMGARFVRGTNKWAIASAFELSLIGLVIASFFLSIQHFNYVWFTVAVSSALYALDYRMNSSNEGIIQPT